MRRYRARWLVWGLGWIIGTLGASAGEGGGVSVFAEAFGDTVVSRDGRKLAVIRTGVQLTDRAAIDPYPAPKKASVAADDGTGAQTGGDAAAAAVAASARTLVFRMPASGPYINNVTDVALDGGVLKFNLSFTVSKAVRAEGFYFIVDVPAPAGAAPAVVLGRKTVTLPADRKAFVRLADAVDPGSAVELPLDGGDRLRIEPPAGVKATLMDMRLRNGVYSLRLRLPPEPEGMYRKGAVYAMAVRVGLPEGAAAELVRDGPETLEAGPDWVALNADLDIEAGSALDLSAATGRHEPAGKFGKVIAKDGGFAFENEPGQPLRRFWGPNLCQSSLFLTKPEVDRLVTRFAAHGYNTVRIHHHESDLVDPASGDTTRLNAAALDRLDYLVAKLIERGFYLTTDLYCSKPVLQTEIWEDGKPGATLYFRDAKVMLGVSDKALENVLAFNRNWLGHVNPYTGKPLAHEPALAWVNTINEGAMVNPFFRFRDKRVSGEFARRWNEWLAAKYGSQAKLKADWGDRLEPNWNLDKRNLPYGHVNYGDDAAGRDTFLFAGELERAVQGKFIAFMRDEMKSPALLCNLNDGRQHIRNQNLRRMYDYVDTHGYMDHYAQVSPPDRMPARISGRHPAADGFYPTGNAFLRLWGKPLTISEYQFAGPNPHRGSGGLVYGAVAALQDMNVLWNFTYAHTRQVAMEPTPMSFFDLARDPFHQAADRAVGFLFLRGDFPPANHTVAIAATAAELAGDTPRNPGTIPSWNKLALVSRVGTLVTDKAGPVPYDVVLPLGWDKKGPGFKGRLATLPGDPYDDHAGAAVLDALRRHAPGMKDNPTDLDANLFHSDNNAFRSDAATATGVVETPRTAGGYCLDGGEVDAGALRFRLSGSAASLWANSLDGKPLPESRRLLVTHLTDLQNIGVSFAEKAHRTLTNWGTTKISQPGPHHLMRIGTAEVALRLEGTEGRAVTVYGLAMNGKRLGTVPGAVEGGWLRFTADTRGVDGGRMYYEIVVAP